MSRLPDLPGGHWPDADELLLLRAALLPPPASEVAWRALRPRFALDDIRAEPYRLVPLLHQNLVRCGVEDPDLGRMRGIRRRTWVENTLRLRGLAGSLECLRAAGIETLVLKGAALAVSTYDDIGLRPMGDVDVMVPVEQRDAAFDALAAVGWPEPVASDRRFFPYRHGYELLRPEGASLDLHWQLGQNLVLRDDPARSTDAFWAAAEPTCIAGVSTRVLCPADALLHVVTHGFNWMSDAHLHWAADAWTIVGAAGDSLDWDRFVRESSRRGALLTARAALEYLGTRLDPVGIPQEVRADLSRRRVGPWERFLFGVRTDPSRYLRGSGKLMLSTARYLHQRGGLGPWATVTGVPEYFREAWGLDHSWQTPLYAARRAVRRARSSRVPGRCRTSRPRAQLRRLMSPRRTRAR